MIARDVLAIRGATRVVAERLVSGLLEGAEGFVREGEGTWRYRTPSSPAAPNRAVPGTPPPPGSRGVLVIGATTWRDPAGRNTLIDIAAGPFGHHAAHPPLTEF